MFKEKNKTKKGTNKIKDGALCCSPWITKLLGNHISCLSLLILINCVISSFILGTEGV